MADFLNFRSTEKHSFLTTADLLALRARLDTLPPTAHWEHEFEGDTTDEQLDHLGGPEIIKV